MQVFTQECETMVNDVVKEFGTVDICVNNAGISKDNLLLRMTPEQWDEVMTTNLKSVFNMTKQVIRPMMKARKGSIINMSSIIGMRGNAGQSSYAASKAGIIGFTKSIAAELGSRNIRCNAIAPGFVETDMTHYLKEGEAAKSFLIKFLWAGLECRRNCQCYIISCKRYEFLYYRTGNKRLRWIET